MIDYINDQLNRWSDWLRSGHTRLGYPRQSAFVSAMGGGRGAEITLPDEHAHAISIAVNALEPVLHETIQCYYRKMKSSGVDQIAKHLGCSRRTVYDRIDRAHVLIMGSLNDLAAGIPVPAWSESQVKKCA